MPDEFTITLDAREVALLLEGMDTITEMARRMKWPLAAVEEHIALMHKIDGQTIHRHKKLKG